MNEEYTAQKSPNDGPKERTGAAHLKGPGVLSEFMSLKGVFSLTAVCSCRERKEGTEGHFRRNRTAVRLSHQEPSTFTLRKRSGHKFVPLKPYQRSFYSAQTCLATEFSG